MNQNVSAVLREAAKTIEDYGWVQRQMTNREGGCCLFWAIEMSGSTPQDRWEAVEFMTKYLMMDIIRWNDTVAKDKEHVIEALEAAADVGMFVK